MSLVGTRPILQDELRQYELHHRARIAIKPGITGMWQVSGRSDITDFEEVVRLDTEFFFQNWEWRKMFLSRNFQRMIMPDYRVFVPISLMPLARSTFVCHLDITPRQNLEISVRRTILQFLLEATSSLQKR